MPLESGWVLSAGPESSLHCCPPRDCYFTLSLSSLCIPASWYQRPFFVVAGGHHELVLSTNGHDAFP
jgi:hypothetical protein